MTPHSLRLLLPFTLLFAIGCSTAPTTTAKKAPPKPKEPETGMHAFFKAYPMARVWAADVQGMSMQSIVAGGIPAKEGKYPAWRVTFISESKRAGKSFNFSIVTADGLNDGVWGGPEESYNGPRGQNSPFAMQALKVDSDKAYAVAMDKGAEYAKKNPDKPITFMLERIKRFPNPAWRVIWGESAGTSNFSIYVDATTGEYLQTMR